MMFIYKLLENYDSGGKNMNLYSIKQYNTKVASFLCLTFFIIKIETEIRIQLDTALKLPWVIITLVEKTSKLR